MESAKDLKAQLVADIVIPFTAAAARRSAAKTFSSGIHKTARVLAASSEFAIGARALDRVPEVQRSVALGVARRAGEYRLAVRVQRQSLMASPLVEHIVKQAKGEADVRLIGRLTKRMAAKGSARSRHERAATGARGTSKVKTGSRGSGKQPTGRAVAVLTKPWYQENQRPLIIGASIGHVDITAGTLGAFVKRAGRVFILSNNHVLANEDAATAGDSVIQRGRHDGGLPPIDHVATLRFWIRFTAKGPNLVDAALAEVEKSIDYNASLLRGLVGGADRQLTGLGPDFLDEGETVYKVGRTTGATEGRVTAFDLDNVVVAYDTGNLRFDGQVEIEGTGNQAFSDGGDSGSIIVNSEMQAVALLFAGGDSGGANGLGLTYANPIHTVLKELKGALML